MPVGVVAQLTRKACQLLSPLTSGHADDLSGAEGVEPVYEGNADLDFGGLAVGISGSDAFTEGF